MGGEEDEVHAGCRVFCACRPKTFKERLLAREFEQLISTIRLMYVSHACEISFVLFFGELVSQLVRKERFACEFREFRSEHRETVRRDV